MHHVELKTFHTRSIGWALFGVNFRTFAGNWSNNGGWADIWYWALFCKTTVMLISQWRELLLWGAKMWKTSKKKPNKICCSLGGNLKLRGEVGGDYGLWRRFDPSSMPFGREIALYAIVVYFYCICTLILLNFFIYI